MAMDQTAPSLRLTRGIKSSHVKLLLDMSVFLYSVTLIDSDNLIIMFSSEKFSSKL